MRLQSYRRLWQCEASNLYLPPEQHAKLRALAGVTNVTVTFGQPSKLNEDCPIGGVYSFFLDCRLPQQLFLGSVVQLVSHVGDFRPRQFLDGAAAWCIAQKAFLGRVVQKMKRCRTALL
jgi:hypothetical protein